MNKNTKITNKTKKPSILFDTMSKRCLIYMDKYNCHNMINPEIKEFLEREYGFNETIEFYKFAIEEYPEYMI